MQKFARTLFITHTNDGKMLIFDFFGVIILNLSLSAKLPPINKSFSLLEILINTK